jgi:hypothetical protein
MRTEPAQTDNADDLGGEVLPGGIVYFGPGEVLPGVMWAAITSRGLVWSRQLCTARAMATRIPAPMQPRRAAGAQLSFDL